MPVQLLQEQEVLRKVRLVKTYADEILKPQDNPQREHELRKVMHSVGLIETPLVDDKAPRVLSSGSSKRQE